MKNSTFEIHKNCTSCDKPLVVDHRDAALLYRKALISPPPIGIPIVLSDPFEDKYCIVIKTQDQKGVTTETQFIPVTKDVKNSELKPLVHWVRFQAAMYETGTPFVLAHCIPEYDEENQRLESLLEALETTPGEVFKLVFDQDQQKYYSMCVDIPYYGDLLDSEWLDRALLVGLAGQQINASNADDFLRSCHILEKASKRAIAGPGGYTDAVIPA